MFRWTFPGGKHVQDVTSVVLVNNTVKTIDETVPAGKRWILLRIKVLNPDDVDRVVAASVYKEAGKTNFLSSLFSETLTAGSAERNFWPIGDYIVNRQQHATEPFEILSGGNTISIVWAAGGASAGGTDADGLTIEYMEVDA